MRRTLLTSAAILPFAAGAALADAHEMGPFAPLQLEHGQNYLATELMGERVYAVDRALDPAQPLPAGASAEFDDIGEIGDLVLDAEGNLQAVIVDVGGFLGLGEREVAVNWSALVPVFEEDDPTEVFITVMSTQEEMENAPEVERVPSPAEQAEADAAMANQPDPVAAQGGMDAQAEDMVEAEDVTVEEDAETVDAENVTIITPESDVEVTTEAAPAETAAPAEVDETAAEAEAAAEGAAQEVEEGAEAAGAAAEDAAQGAENALEGVGAAIGTAAQEAGTAIQGAAEGAAQQAGEAAESLGDAAAEAGAEIEAETDEAASGN